MSKSEIQEWMWWKLLGNDELVREGLLELYFQQTQDERNINQTTHQNKSGFSRAHVKLGTLLARKLMDQKSLSDEEMNKARRLVIHYHKQVSHLLPMPKKTGSLVSLSV